MRFGDIDMKIKQESRAQFRIDYETLFVKIKLKDS